MMILGNIILGEELNTPLAYAPGLELHPPIMNTLGKHGCRLYRDIYISFTLLCTLNSFLFPSTVLIYCGDNILRLLENCATWKACTLKIFSLPQLSLMTCFSPSCPVRSHSLVYSENYF